MIELNPDYKHIKGTCPAYIDKLEQFDRELFSKFNCQLGMEFDDHSNSSLRFWVQKPRERLNDNELNPEINLLLENLKITLKETCSQCGSNHIVSFRNELYHSNSHYVDQMHLCEECFSNYNREELRLSKSSYSYFSEQKKILSYELKVDKFIVKKEVRFINELNQFDSAKFGSYFFYGDGFYVITDKIIYKDFDIKKKFINTIYNYHLHTQTFIIKGLYAGHDTGFRDDLEERIYTGDIIRMKGASSNERDPHNFFEKDRNIPKENQNLFEVYGVVSSYEFCREAYQVVLDNHGAFLCHGSEMEVLGNIFYDLTPEERIDVWRIACQIAQSGGFWNIHTRETIKENLKNIKSPSFKMLNKQSPLNQKRNYSWMSIFNFLKSTTKNENM